MKLYIDTSVFGGYFEREFESWSQRLIAQIIDGDYVAVVSDLTLVELEAAPANVRQLAEKVITENAELLATDDAARKLASFYLKEKIVTLKSQSDALHIAIATVHKVDVLTSGNFKHIVNYDKIRMYNSVNLKYGHGLVEIRSPRDLVTI